LRAEFSEYSPQAGEIAKGNFYNLREALNAAALLSAADAGHWLLEEQPTRPPLYR
jgi:hypothetical protein